MSWERRTPELLIGVLHKETVSTEWSVFFKNLAIPMPYVISFQRGVPFDVARNFLVDQLYDYGCDWLFFLDSDVMCPADTIQRLLAHQQPIVSALYYRRHPPYNPCMWKAMEKPSPQGAFAPISDWPKGQVIDVDVTGAGVLLIHRSVFDKIQGLPMNRFLSVMAYCVDCRRKQPPVHSVATVTEEGRAPPCPVCGGSNMRIRKPYFEWSMGKVEKGTSEDFNFSIKAKEAGFRILVDTSIVCWHDVSGKVGEKGIEGYGV